MDKPLLLLKSTYQYQLENKLTKESREDLGGARADRKDLAKEKGDDHNREMCHGSDCREREILWSVEETMLSPEETLWSPEDEFVVNLYLNFQFLGQINLPNFDLMYPTLSSNRTTRVVYHMILTTMLRSIFHAWDDTLYHCQEKRFYTPCDSMSVSFNM